MKQLSFFRAISVSSILPLATAVMAIAIFVFDTITDLEIAVAAFYVVVVLVSVTFCQRRGIMLISAGCLTLTLLSYFLTRTGSAQPGLINGLISLTAIAATTYLALKIVAIDTEVQVSRERLAHVARVTTLGELTASIAHEVNQPLAAVVTNANACSRWLAADPPNHDEATKAIDRIVRDANRASNVVARVRSLAKRARPDRTWVSLNEVILEVVALTQPDSRRSGISLHTDLAHDLPPISGDRIQLQQVVLNLVMNAIDATKGSKQGPHDISIVSAQDGDNRIAVAIRDSGIGLDQANLDQIFEGFFTTKPEGLGMGLTICRSIVEAHGGRITAAPGAPRGAVFRFTLPIARRNTP
jgi:signal transduction histidine kinase